MRSLSFTLRTVILAAFCMAVYATQANTSVKTLALKKAKDKESSKYYQYNSFTDVGYKKPYDWQYAQGLTCDGEYYYFAGHHDRTGELADIHKIRMSDAVEVALFEKEAPMHSPGLDWNEYNDTVLSCCYGPTLTPCVWELDKNTGKAINQWDCPEVGLKAGGLIAWVKKNDIILLTSTENGANLGFTRLTLLPDGKFIERGTWYYSETNLGVPQGMDYKDGYIWFLADAGKTINDNPHAIYLLKLNKDKKKTVSLLKEYRVDLPVATEGLTFDTKGNLYYGTAEEKIYKIDLHYKKMKPWLEPK